MRFLSILVAVGLLQLGPAAPAPTELLFSRLGDYLEALRTLTGIPGMSAVVVGENDILWERSFGQQDLSRSLQTSTDTPFHLDGVTQVFSSTMVLQCVQDGLLSLDDSVSKFDPD